MTIDAACLETRESIPWVANETASDAERVGVHAHIALCGECRADLAKALALRRRMAELADALPAAAPSDCPTPAPAS